MTWYNSDFKNRYPVTIENTGGAETSGTIDVSISIPSDWDAFWENIRADGFDIVLTDSLGTQLTFKRATFTPATRTCTIEGDNITVGNMNSIVLLYIYFNNPDQTIDLSSAFTATGPKTGKIYLNAPSLRIVGDPNQRTGSKTANYTFSKTTLDEVYIWFHVGSLMAKRIQPYNAKLGFESLDYVQVFSYDSGGSDDTNRYNETLTAFIPGWVGVYVKAGSNNTDYAVACNIRTAGGGPFNQSISLRCLLSVRDLLPT